MRNATLLVTAEHTEQISGVQINGLRREDSRL